MWESGHLEQLLHHSTVTSVLADRCANYQELFQAAPEEVSKCRLLYVSELCGWHYCWWWCPLSSRCRPDGVPYPTLDPASAQVPLSDPLLVPLWGPHTAPGACPSTSLRTSHIIIIIPACVRSTRQFLTRKCFHRLVHFYCCDLRLSSAFLGFSLWISFVDNVIDVGLK